MSKLTIRSNFGTAERPNIRQVEIKEGVSEKFLSHLFACSIEDLSSIASENNITREVRVKGSKQKPVIFYSVDDAIKLLEGLKERVNRLPVNDGGDWVTSLDTSGKEIKVVLPTGSELIFERQ